MKRAAKWIGVILGALVLLCVAAIILVPMLVDLNKYKPVIEKKVSEATGRPFRLGGEIKLSLFPWAGVNLSDLHLGNPEGFKEKDFASVKSFEVRVKVMPLIRKALEVETFVLNTPRIYLHKDSKGRANWEGFGGKAAEKTKSPPEAEKTPSGLPLAALAVGEFAVKDGYLVMQDDTSGTRNEVSDINVAFKDVSLDKPIGFNISAKMDGKPLSVDGMVGPVGKMPGMGPVAFGITVKAFGELAATLKGKVVDAAVSRRFGLDLEVSPFSPRRLMESLGRKFPLATSDPEVLKKFSIAMHISGDPSRLNIVNGKMELDSSKMDFNASLSEFDRPKASFDMGLDDIDLDRYMPPASEDKKENRQAKAPEGQNKAKSDYSALRKHVIAGTFKAGSIKIKGVKAENILFTLDARDGLFQIKPLRMDLYKGNMALTAQYDVRKDTPAIAAQIKAAGIQARPLLMDMAGKDLIEGTANVTADIRTIGEDPMVIKENLDGAGELLFNDGAIVGIDLAGMLRNLTVSFGLEKESAQKPRTDFSELKIPFKIEKGVASTDGTNITSPLLRVSAVGKADLVKETLDFRVEPMAVATLKGQGDTKERSGLMVPVLIKGTFSSPSFAPDLEGMLKQGLDKGLSDPAKIKEQFKGLLPEKGIGNFPEGTKLKLPLGR